jgi:pimeloyl-ACP methyl ester carboxylesterase
MPEITLSRGKIYYEIHGEGRPLIGLHHGMSCIRTWKEQIAAFSNRFCFVVYDRLGHGRSERHAPYEPDYFENRADELRELIDELDFDSVHLCGLCEGGAVALVFASFWPERVKTLILPSVGYYGDDQTISKCEQYFHPWEELNESVRNRLIRDHGEGYATLKWEAVREAKPYVWSRSYDLRPICGSIEASTLVMGGDRDQFFGTEHPIVGYEHIKNSELCILPKVGHFLNEEAPVMFNEVALDFLHRYDGTQ